MLSYGPFTSCNAYQKWVALKVLVGFLRSTRFAVRPGE